MNELMDWIKHNDYSHCVENFEAIDDNCFVTLDRPKNFADNIVCLFETIMLEQNQAAKAHERLREILSNVVFEPGKKEITRLVDKYISECEHINLEGFVTFRLGKYTHKIDLVLYAAIKNALTST